MSNCDDHGHVFRGASLTCDCKMVNRSPGQMGAEPAPLGKVVNIRPPTDKVPVVFRGDPRALAIAEFLNKWIDIGGGSMVAFGPILGKKFRIELTIEEGSQGPHGVA